MIEDNLILKQEMFSKREAWSSFNFISKIPGIYMTYTKYMHGICHAYTRFSEKQSMLDELEVHIRSMAFQDNYSIALKRHDLLSDRYIPDIYHAYTMHTMRRSKSLASPLSCPSALGSLRPGLPSELLSFSHREAAHARLGPSKVPQPGVDLVNMAALQHSITQKRPPVGCCTYVE